MKEKETESQWLAGMFSYSRDQEREADRIGVQLMEESGYQPAEAAKVWGNLVEEVKARPGGASGAVPMFATHPDAEERRDTLAAMAASMPAKKPACSVGNWIVARFGYSSSNCWSMPINWE